MMIIIMTYLYCLFSGLCINAISSPDLQHKLHLLGERGYQEKVRHDSSNNSMISIPLPAVVFTTSNDLIMYTYTVYKRNELSVKN